MDLIDNITRSKMAGVEFKRYKSANGMDGRIWSADLYLNGRRLGELVAEGFGPLATNVSSDDVSAVATALKGAGYVLEAPDEEFPVPVPPGDFGYFETALGFMAAEVEDLKALKKKAKVKTMFELTDGMCYEIKAPFTTLIGDQIRKEYGDRLKCITNEELAAL